MISLRLSDGEYALLKSRYRNFGARNVSDLARLALAQIMQGAGGPHDGLSAKIEKLEDRVCALESQVSSLSTRTA
jgi:hypothetical protein